MRTTFRSYVILMVLGAITACPSCYHYYVRPPGPEAPATDWHGATGHALFWGLAQTPNPIVAHECEASNNLHDVKVTSNFGYSLLTVVTLGIWAPVELEWRCAKQPAVDWDRPGVAPPPARIEGR